MHFLKNKSDITKFWKPLVVICLNILQYNNIKCEGKSLIFLANGEERSRPLLSERNTPINLTCHMADSTVQIQNDKGQPLNTTVGVVSVVINSTTCKDAGTYICKAPGQLDVHTVLFINGCDPFSVACDYKHDETILTADPTTDANVEICFLINKENLQTSVMQYGNRWIRQNATDEKIKFDVIQNKTDPLHKILNITIKNITVYDYGEIDIALPVTESHIFKFKIYVSKEGERKVQFARNANNESDLMCTAYNYPKTVSIRKVMPYKPNTLLKENKSLNPYLNIKYVTQTFSCSDVGTYECVVTDMQGKTRIYEYTLLSPSCSDKFKFCEWQPKIVTIKSYVGGTVNFTVCVFNTLKHTPLGNITQIPENSFNYTFNTTGVYTAIRMSISKITETSFKNYKIHIGESIDVNVVKADGMIFCNNKSEDIINIKPNERAIFRVCIKTKESLSNKIFINSKEISKNGSKNQYEIFEDYISEEEKSIKIEILNFIALSTRKYKVQIFSTSESTLFYTVIFNITEPLLEHCKGSHDNETVAVRLNSTAVVHLCISSNIGLGDYISIDNVPHQIYDSNRTCNYCVSADVINKDRPFDYYLQIYIRKVTQADIGPHEILIKPTKSKQRIFRFSLQLNTDRFPVSCTTCVPKTYFFSKVGNLRNLKFCVLAKHFTKQRILLNNIEHEINDIKDNRSVSLQCKTDLLDNNLTKYVIQLQFTVQIYNFTRYKIQVFFGEDSWNHTFYLLDEENLKIVECKEGTTCSNKKTYVYSNVSFCMRVFGVMDNNILINNRSYSIEPIYSKKNVIVVQYFSIHTLICHLVVYINNLTIGDFTNYNVVLPSIENIYTYKVDIIKVPLKVNFYARQIGRDLEATSVFAANVGQGLVLTCKVPTKILYHVNVKIIFESRTLKETNKNKTIEFTYEQFTCQHLGTYTCIVDMEFQISKKEMTLHNGSCHLRWCDSENHDIRYNVSVGRDFQLPLCLISYTDQNLMFILNGTVLRNVKNINVVYEKISYDNISMIYKANVTVRNVSLKDFGYYNLIIMHNESSTVYLNRSFFLQGKENNGKQNNSMTLIIISVIVITVLILITLFSILIFTVKRKARIKKNDCLNSRKAYESVKSEIDFHENVSAPYANASNLKVNNDYENIKGRREVIPLIDMNDLNKKMDNRIYLNSQELSEIAPRYCYKTDKDNCNSKSDRDSKGLIYITLAHVDHPTSTAKTRSREHKDDVVYATLDYDKTGKMTLHERETFGKKTSKRKNDSQIRKATEKKTVKKISSLPEHKSTSRRIRLEDFSKSTSL